MSKRPYGNYVLLIDAKIRTGCISDMFSYYADDYPSLRIVCRKITDANADNAALSRVPETFVAHRCPNRAENFGRP